MSLFSEKYTKEIEKDLGWRETELAILRRHLQQASVGSVQEKALLRANLAMVYAHYEGFCKFSLGVYVDALNRRKLKVKNLKWPIAAHSLTGFITALKREERPDKFMSKLFSEFDAQLEQFAECKNIAESSNLWPDQLISWLQRLGLPTANVMMQENFLKELVNTRNKVAHGESMHIQDMATFVKYADAANLAMHEVAVEVAEALEKATYQRNAEDTTTFGHALPTVV